jgi:P pilus assembly chaperone PapD
MQSVLPDSGEWVKKLIQTSIFMAVVILCAFLKPVYGQNLGGISVSPTRIIFEGRQRTAEVTLINKSNKPSTYRVYFENMRMREDGKIVKIEEPQTGEKFSEQLIRYSPRQITVPPGKSQSVRLLLRKPRDLPPGEYRSHLFFKSLPPKETGKDIEQEVLKSKEIKIKLVAVLALSIPVIVRQGDLSAKVGLSNLGLKTPKAPNASTTLSIDVLRKGNQSVYGDIHVIFQNKKGQRFKVAELEKFSIYTPNKSRTVEFPLRIPSRVSLKNGNLYVFYKETEDAGGRILAKAKLPIP